MAAPTTPAVPVIFFLAQMRAHASSGLPFKSDFEIPSKAVVVELRIREINTAVGFWQSNKSPRSKTFS